MTSSPAKALIECSVITVPTSGQASNILNLYCAQGWWRAVDDAEENLIAKLISGSHCFVIASEGDTIIGMGRAISDGISDAYIQDLTVRLDHRKQGIGRMILKTILARLHADGIRWIGLIAEPGSARLYKQFGFEEMAGSTPMLMIKES